MCQKRFSEIAKNSARDGRIALAEIAIPQKDLEAVVAKIAYEQDAEGFHRERRSGNSGVQ